MKKRKSMGQFGIYGAKIKGCPSGKPRIMARLAGFEPATNWFEASYFIHKLFNKNKGVQSFPAPFNSTQSNIFSLLIKVSHASMGQILGLKSRLKLRPKTISGRQDLNLIRAESGSTTDNKTRVYAPFTSLISHKWSKNWSIAFLCNPAPALFLTHKFLSSSPMGVAR